LQKAGAGLEEPPAALLGLRLGVLLPSLQVGEVGLAKRAGDRLQVEFDVILVARFEGLQEVRTKLLAGRAAESMPPPDGPDGMFAAVAFLNAHGQLAAKPVGIAEGLFDPGRLSVGEGIVEVAAQVFAGDLGHGAYCSKGAATVSKPNARQGLDPVAKTETGFRNSLRLNNKSDEPAA
jgi:hypothetical protein